MMSARTVSRLSRGTAARALSPTAARMLRPAFSSRAPAWTRLIQDGPSGSQVHLAAQGVDDLHQQRLAVHPDPGDPDVAIAAPAALHDITPLRGKAGGHHVVDLAGYAIKSLGQVIALDLQHTTVRLLQTLLQEAGNQIEIPTDDSSLSKERLVSLTLTFFNLLFCV